MVRTKEQNLAELDRMEGDMAALLQELDGHAFEHQPMPLVQARIRFHEAMMWVRSWIDPTNSHQ